MLSNEDIKKEIGRNLLVHPLKIENIRGSSLNLTASKYAWSLSTKELIVDGLTITIPPRDTALIETEESIHVGPGIAGSYHSKVTLVSGGLGHIGTLLDPEWIGQSLVAVHNVSDRPYRLRVGDTFVSLCFFYLKSLSTYSTAGNTPGRPTVLQQYDVKVSPHHLEELRQDWRCNRKDLKSAMVKSEEYRRLELIRTKRSLRQVLFHRSWPFMVLIVAYLLLYSFRLRINVTIGDMRLDEWFLIVGLSGFAVKFLELGARARTIPGRTE